MLVYSPSHKNIVTALKAKSWHTELIQKYLNYVQKKERAVITGRTAYTDSTRGKTYKAEWKFQNKFHDSIKEFKTEKQAAAYMNRVLNSKMWKEMTKGKVVSLKVKTIGHRTAGRAYGSHIELNKMNGMDQYTLLHEMAHCAGHMHHDVSFRQCVLKLTSRFIGTEAAKFLKGCFKEQGLKMTMPKGSVKDPDTWLKTYNRLEGVREKI
jgi:hypothetical protein